MAERPQLQAPPGAADTTCTSTTPRSATRSPPPRRSCRRPRASPTIARSSSALASSGSWWSSRPPTAPTTAAPWTPWPELGAAARAVVVVDQIGERGRARAPDRSGRARHPLPHAEGRRPALGDPRGDGSPRAPLRLARAIAVQRPRAARARGHAQAPARRPGDRPRRPLHGPGAARPPRLQTACCACSRSAAPGSSCPRPTRARRSGPPAYEDVSALAMALVRAAPERMLWASNWPHPGHDDPRSATTPTCSIS